MKPKENELVEYSCYECDKVFTCESDTACEYNRRIYCPQCSFTCDDCTERVPLSVSREVHGGGDVCEECVDDHYYFCDGCEMYFHSDSSAWQDGHNGQCSECTDSQSIGEREYQNNGTFKSSKQGDILKSTRVFGVEVECLKNGDFDDTIAKIHEDIGYSEDGSIRGDGVEFQLPPASGEKGEKMVKSFCDVLATQKYEVNASCGLHVHVSATDLKYQDIRKTFGFYLSFEDVLLSFLPKSRGFNEYCYQLKKDYQLNEILEATSREMLERIWYRESSTDCIDSRKSHNKDSSRYHGINFHTLFSRDTLEIRYHSGTISSKKILEWVNLHATILDVCTAERSCLETYELSKYYAITDIQEKTNLFFNLLKLSESSRAYFLARQSLFYKIPEYPKTDIFIQTVKDITSEREQN